MPNLFRWWKRDDPDGERLVRIAAAGSEDDRRRAMAGLTRHLLVSSRRLESLTWVLGALTLALIGATIALAVTG
jgi:hypothetical protein